MLTNLLIIILAGVIGLLSHYLVRWKQGRTTSSLSEYLFQEWGSTLLSLITNIMACITIFKALPIDPSIIDIVEAVYAAYMSGYMFDSALNTDPNPSVPEPKHSVKVQRSTGPAPIDKTSDILDDVSEGAKTLGNAVDMLKRFTK